MRVVWLALAAVLTLSIPSSAEAQQRSNVSSATVLWFGVFKPGETKEIKDSTSPTGTRFVMVDIIPPSTNSDRIAIKDGTDFGVGYLLVGSPKGGAVTIRHVQKYPDPGVLQESTGRRSLSYEGSFSYKIGNKLHIGYTIGSTPHPPGAWTFQVWQGNRMLLEKTFTLYIP